jgi:hypothetical protein
MTAATENPCSITEVRVLVAARRFVKDAEARVVIGVGGSIFEGAATTLSDNYEVISASWPANPATGANWSWSDLAGLEAGVSLRSTKETQAARCTQVQLIVTYED